ncbi:MAG: oligopeptide transport system permease protein [Thermosediminibacterales bacterium]|nr:oligopeptide transport system permease protein [Thermosediminibacterales bacterium]MDK2836424.1 oligopeptide transport system permease protein [Thermosediminibacterales bacterium]
MLNFVIKRTVSMIVVILFIVTLTFVLMHAIPGSPFTDKKKLPESIRKNIEKRYHLDEPFLKQYCDYILNMFKGDLGLSLRYEGRRVNDIIKKGFPVSATLGLLSIFFSLMTGIPLGILSAIKHRMWIDRFILVLTTFAASVPGFVSATVLIYFFSVKLGWFPAALWGSPSQMVLPVLALSLYPGALIARLMRNSMVDVLSQDYISVVRAWGLPCYAVIWKHAFKNAVLPIITHLGPMSAGILTGSFVIEKIFALPGLGQHFVTSIINRDYTVIMGVTVFYSVLLVLMNFLVDMVCCFIDPRVKM